MDFPIAAGPYEPTWDSIARNYPGDPAWLREAKFGYGCTSDRRPRAKAATGTRARFISREPRPMTTISATSAIHRKPDIKTCCIHGIPTKLDPARLVQIYHDAGARFLSSRAYITITSTTGTQPISLGTR